MKEHQLSEADMGHHAKIASLLADPAIAADLRAYVHSNKWCMDPEKLTQFTRNELIPTAAEKYIHHITNQEMPLGLKCYMELELFPCLVRVFQFPQHAIGFAMKDFGSCITKKAYISMATITQMLSTTVRIISCQR
jgi:hypothetical protein